ncbi:hypothetical protein IL306_013134 [Fusarium sp. DS 682]|nr:hypothetical protein IL306_013134 [Fusarium sp. DS 682]
MAEEQKNVEVPQETMPETTPAPAPETPAEYAPATEDKPAEEAKPAETEESTSEETPKETTKETTKEELKDERITRMLQQLQDRVESLENQLKEMKDMTTKMDKNMEALMGLPGNVFAKLNLQVGQIEILNTSETGIHIQALVNITNPTPYAAIVPYFNTHIQHKGEILREAIATDVDFGLGINPNIIVRLTWDPVRFGGENAREVGRKLLSDYLFGKNTTMTAKTHHDSIPSIPLLGEALSNVNFTIPTPRVRIPGEDEDVKQRFITSATFHILSSSATFGLVSPLLFNTLHIEDVSATAFYNHTETVGNWIETVHYRGKGIEAKVSL